MAIQFAYPSEDLAVLFPSPTLTVGTQDAEYPIANLSSSNPAKPWKVTTTTFRLLWDFGSAKTVKAVGLIHPNFAAALANVKIALGATTATTDFSRSFVVGAYGEDGYPSNPYLDLTDYNPSYRYMSLEASTANIVPISIGRFMAVTALRSLPGFIIPKSPNDEEQHPISEHKTAAGVVTIYSLGVRRRWIRGEMGEYETNAAALRSWRRSAQGRTLTFFLLPHMSPDEVWCARFEKDKMQKNYIGRGISYIPEGFEEVSRGLKPTPSAV